MDSTVVAALIGAGAAIVPSLLSWYATMNKFQHKMELDIALLRQEVRDNQLRTDEHFKRLDEKQDKHNNLIERTTILERDQKTLFRAVDDLKDEKK